MLFKQDATNEMEMERVFSTFIHAAIKTAEKKKNVHTFQVKVL